MYDWRRCTTIPAEEFRTPILVISARVYRDGNIFYDCPRCNAAIDYDYQAFCHNCGQALRWRMRKITLRYI